jgi:hypothetical protein
LFRKGGLREGIDRRNGPREGEPNNDSNRAEMIETKKGDATCRTAPDKKINR